MMPPSRLGYPLSLKTARMWHPGLTVPYRPLVPDDDRSLNPCRADDTLIIHGDS